MGKGLQCPRCSHVEGPGCIDFGTLGCKELTVVRWLVCWMKRRLVVSRVEDEDEKVEVEVEEEEEECDGNSDSERLRE